MKMCQKALRHVRVTESKCHVTIILFCVNSLIEHL